MGHFLQILPSTYTSALAGDEVICILPAPFSYRRRLVGIRIITLKYTDQIARAEGEANTLRLRGF